MNWNREKHLILLLCEGNGEKAIIDILLDNHLLKFQRDMLIDETIHQTRKAKRVQNQFLQHDYGNKQLDIVRVLDSPKERF